MASFIRFAAFRIIYITHKCAKHWTIRDLKETLRNCIKPIGSFRTYLENNPLALAFGKTHRASDIGDSTIELVRVT